MTPTPNRIHVVTVCPSAGIACGDDANGPALVRRAQARGLIAEHVVVEDHRRLPPADVYLLGGTGTSHVPVLVERLADSALPDAVANGAAVLAVDTGIEVLGGSLRDPATGPTSTGLGLVAVDSTVGALVEGRLVTHPAQALPLPALSGWVHHDRRVVLGAGVEPLARVDVGCGDQTQADGFWSGRIVGTRLHGPVLAAYPELADLLLALATDRSPTDWPDLPSPLLEEARRNRIDEDRAAWARQSRRRVTDVVPRRLRRAFDRPW